ncbi:MAG: hypothetical protein HY014_16325 [Acidobacteria bacterium]|nr:hypothetical protein [Acidobacteriota bacterium]MBI3489697.1 hypothetical protein [Acidobacteriota bacterium]
MDTMKVPCCPELLRDDNCDVLVFTRTLNYPFLYKREVRLAIQLVLTFRLKRCTLGLVLGDPVYSTTLLPGEKVRLATTDRRTSFTYDASTKLSYRSEQISEEQYWMNASQSYFSDLENSQSGHDVSTDKGHWDFSGSAGGSVSLVPWDPGVSASSKASGNHDSSSTLDYLHRQSSNMHAAATQAVHATHTAHAISIGEVATRTHIEGESEDHFEASSREYSNPNACHAITYLFYRINKKQKVSFELLSIDRLISYPGLANNLAAAPAGITPAMRADILKQLDAELQAAGILGEDGLPAAALKKQLELQLEFSLPTAGIIVKGCLDECNTCEPARRERVHLENELLRKQIELLEKSQEYRCCPKTCGDADSDDDE